MPPLALSAGLAETANVLREAANRVAGLPELVGSLAGSRRRKALRVAVAVLQDESGAAVARDADVRRALDEAARVLREHAGIDLAPAREPLVQRLDGRAPASALDTACAEGSWKADFQDGGAFFRGHAAQSGARAKLTAPALRSTCSSSGTWSGKPDAPSVR